MSEQQGPAEFSQPSGGESSAPAEQQETKAPAKKAPAKKAAAKATTKRRKPIRAGGHVLDLKTGRWVPAGLERGGK
jgi:hypothetical protein